MSALAPEQRERLMTAVKRVTVQAPALPTPASREHAELVLQILARIADEHGPRAHGSNRVLIDLDLCRKARFALCLGGKRPDPAELEPVIDGIVGDFIREARQSAERRN